MKKSELRQIIKECLNEAKYPGGYVMESMLDALEQIRHAAGGLDYRLSEKSPVKLDGEIEFSKDEKKKMQSSYSDLEKARKLVGKAIQSIEKVNLGYSSKR